MLRVRSEGSRDSVAGHGQRRPAAFPSVCDYQFQRYSSVRSEGLVRADAADCDRQSISEKAHLDRG